MLKVGIHRAKISKYGIGETSEQSGKKPQMVVGFDVYTLPEGYTVEDFDAEKDPGEQLQTESITWYGSFVEGEARRITNEVLVKMGFEGDYAELSKGSEGGSTALDTKKVYALSINENTWNGKTSLRVSSVFLPGEQGPGARLLSSADAKKALSGLGLEGDFKKMKSEKGTAPSNAKPQAAAPASGAHKPRF